MSDLPKIILTLPNGEIRKYSLEMDSVRIGRAADNTIVLDDGGLSSHHAVLHRRNNGIEILDLGSTNGIEFHGKRVLTHYLKHGHVLKIGSVLLRFDCPSMPDDVPPQVESAPVSLGTVSEGSPPPVASESDDGLEDAQSNQTSAPTDEKPKSGCLASVVLFFLTLLAPVIGLHLRHYMETHQILALEMMKTAPNDGK